MTVIHRVEVGRDPGNNPIYEETTEDVSDVLVAPGPRADVLDAVRPEGVEIKWNLHFPKSFAGDLRGAAIRVRGGEPLDVIGAPAPYTLANTPTRWWMPVEIGDVRG